MSICKHDYKDIGYGVEKCTKCKHQRVHNETLYHFHTKHFFNEMKEKFKHLNSIIENDKRTSTQG